MSDKFTYVKDVRVKVFHDGLPVGTIIEERDGWVFYPRDGATDGKVFETLSAVYADLEDGEKI
jgi:hypothetical protein